MSLIFKGLALQKSLPMNYYTVFHHIRELIPKDCILVSEGANTMDIGRTMLPNYHPRQRCGIFFVVLTQQARSMYKCFHLAEKYDGPEFL